MPKGGNKNIIIRRGQGNLPAGRQGLPGIFYTLGLAFFIFGIFSFPVAGQAAVAGYTAEKISQSYGSMVLAPGKAITFEVAFKNTGTVTWYNSSRNYISLYADNYGKMFRHKYWHTVDQPGKLLETKVLPGEVGHLRFALQAPEVLGLYTAKFKLASEDLTWIPGGILEIPINVTNNTAVSAPAPVASGTVLAAAENFGAMRLIQSSASINLGAGSKINFNVGFKNIGSENWETGGENTVKICLAHGVDSSAFSDVSWLEENCPVTVSSTTLPKQIGYFSFTMQGNTAGDFNAGFVLMNGDKVVSGGEVVVPIKITGYMAAPVLPAPVIPPLSEESVIRVGLYSTIELETITANGAFDVKDANGNLVFTIPAGSGVTVSFNAMVKNYSASFGGTIKDGLSYLDFIAQDKNTIFEITSLKNPPAWNTSLNDNKFRGNLEFRYSEGRDKVYMINEVSLEDYMKGLAESSNNNPIEYHKALAVAARTYAQYNINTGGKHPAGYFHLNASSYDQVYRGYNSEIRLPNFVKAVEETRGMVVVYNNEIVVTPYFSQSDGRTRAWEEVWWGSGKPWLVSRPDPNCSGMALFGHGVGLSARGARGMALEGNNYEQILKHYYTGIELKKIY